MLKYQGVAEDIIQRIRSGEYKPNDRLPTIDELCAQYDVSKITIKKAMDELEVHGLIARRRGSGTYVKGTLPEGDVTPHGWNVSSQLSGFTNEHVAEGHEVGSDVRDFSVVHPPENVAEELGMEPDEFAYHITRVRLLDGVPRVVEYTYMPLSVIPGLRERNVETSIYGYIQGELGLKVASAHRTIEAVLVSPEETGWLQVEPGSPALQVQQVVFLDDGRSFEYSVSRHVRGYKFYSISTN